MSRTRPHDLRRLSGLVALDVADVRRAEWRDWGRGWALELADGRLVVIGHDRHVRDKALLAERLTEAGAELPQPMTWGRARRVLELCVRVDANDYPERTTR